MICSSRMEVEMVMVVVVICSSRVGLEKEMGEVVTCICKEMEVKVKEVVEKC